MRRCAFLTMDNLEDFCVYDRLLFEPFKQLGWHVEEVSWRRGDIDWNQFEVVIIRSPWDYQKDPAAFLQALERIDASSSRLENPLELVKWNLNKSYLRDLEEQGVPIVPTRWPDCYDRIDLENAFSDWQTTGLVIKPRISANADFTWRLDHETWEDHDGELKAAFETREIMLQPYIPSIASEGEYSLFYFGETFSHAILKVPKSGDFRVQEEHGGQLRLIEPEAALKQAGDLVMEGLNPRPLYSRVDLVRHDGRFLLMELELIEPSLYFQMDPKSPTRFARVFSEWMKTPNP